MNGDGHLDAVVAQDTVSNVVTLLGNGDGTFGDYLQSFTLHGGYDGAFGDFNLDGLSDLLVGGAILINNGTGSFGHEIRIDTEGGWVATGDLDLDGDLDVLTLDHGNPKIRVNLGEGGGRFAASTPFSLEQEGQLFNGELGDFDEDGVLDLAALSIGPGTVTVLRGNGDGTFDEQASFAVLDGTPFGILVDDWNDDAHLDVVVGTDYGSQSSLLLGAGDGTFEAARPVATGFTTGSFASADIDGDGSLDLVTGHGLWIVEEAYASVDAVVNFHSGSGDGTFADSREFPIGTVQAATVGYYLGLATGDLDEDGRPDVVVTSGAGGDLSVLLSTPSGHCVPAR